MKPPLEVPCPQCGAIIAAWTAPRPGDHCPQCNAPLAPKSRVGAKLTWIFATLTALWCLLLFVGGGAYLLWRMRLDRPLPPIKEVAQAPKPAYQPFTPEDMKKKLAPPKTVIEWEAEREQAKLELEKQKLAKEEEAAKAKADQEKQIADSKKQRESEAAKKKQAEADSAKSVAKAIPAPKTSQKALTRRTYHWADRNFNAWKFEIKAPANSGLKNYSGISSFYTKPKKSAAALTKGKGTGSAFVVTPTGYLVTCAHVIDDATTIQVHLGGITYEASVIAIHASNDLALLKIEAANLPTIGLAPPNSIELAQEVRSVGFPLSEVLGNSIKINRGTISGKVQREDRELLQIDAPINPGNSGGPVVDLLGNVVGVASEKIHGQAISNVGFCVPSKIVEEFLREQNVQPKAPSTVAAADGPALARAVTPAVAMVEVETASQEGFEIFDCSVLHSLESNIYAIPHTQHGAGSRGKLTVSADGRLLELEGNLQAPFLFGPVAALSLVSLPKPWQSSWGSSRETKLAFIEEDRSQDPLERLMQSRYRRYSPFGPPPQVRIVTIDAVESEQLKTLETKDDVLTIERTWRFATQSDPKLEVNGVWTYQFNEKQGAVLDVKGTTDLSVASKSITAIEIAMQPTVIDLASANAPTNPLASTPGYVTPPGANSPAPTPFPPEISESLKKLEDSKTITSDRIAALESLTKVKLSTPHRKEVLDQLVKEMASTDVTVAVAAINALTHWDAATRVEAVTKQLKNDASPVREAVVKYLGSMQDGAAAPALVEALSDAALRPSIYTALRSIGPTGEPGVLIMLQHQEVEVRAEGCRILAEIGTSKCVEELRRLAKLEGAADEPVKSAAKAALAALGKSETAPATVAKPTTTDDKNPFEPGTSEEDPFKPSPPTDPKSEENPFEPKKKP